MIVTSGLGFFTYQYGIKAIVSQFFGGIAHSFAIISYTIITSEIASPRKRGLLITQGLIAFYFGMFLYVVNLKFMNNFMNLPALMLAFSVSGYLFIYLFHMESPMTLILEGKIQNAHYILEQMSSDNVNQAVTNDSKDLEKQHMVSQQNRANDSYDNLVVLMELNEEQQQKKCRPKSKLWKLCSATIALKVLTLLANTHIIQTIMLGMVLKRNESVCLQIFICVAQSPLIGLIFSTFWIDTVGRRLLLLISSGGIATLLVLAGIVNVWSGFDEVNWLHAVIFGMGMAQFLNGFGIVGVHQTILSEIYPLNTKCYYLACGLIFETILQGFIHFSVFSFSMEWLAIPWESLATSDFLSTVVTFLLSFTILLLSSCLYKFLPETSGQNLKMCIDKFR
jgi:MFS family permease